MKRHLRCRLFQAVQRTCLPIVPALLFITVFLSETVSATAFKITPFNDYDILGNEISDPGFSQTLHYADGPGTKLYNGSVSAMSWTMGADATQRGYKFKYNDYNWLTATEYGEGASLTANRDRYTERTTEFMRNGGIRRLQRHGLKADGNYGKIDNLHIYYTGNRVTGVLEDAEPVTTNGSMD